MSFSQLAIDMGLGVGLPPIVINSLSPPSKRVKEVMRGRKIVYKRPYKADGKAMTGEEILANVKAEAELNTLTYQDGSKVSASDVEVFALYCDSVGRDPTNHRAVIDWMMS